MENLGKEFHGFASHLLGLASPATLKGFIVMFRSRILSLVALSLVIASTGCKFFDRCNSCGSGSSSSATPGGDCNTCAPSMGGGQQAMPQSLPAPQMGAPAMGTPQMGTPQMGTPIVQQSATRR